MAIDLRVQLLPQGIYCIFLNGSLDIAGVQEISLKFTAYTATQRTHVLVDVSGLNFIASLGIRLLLSNAKSLHTHGARMILIGPSAEVDGVLEMTGIKEVISIEPDQDRALQSLLTA